MRSVLEAPGVKGHTILRLPCHAGAATTTTTTTIRKRAVTELVRGIVATTPAPAPAAAATSAFSVLDLGEVSDRFAAWQRGFKGGVPPYYAVKCNANRALLGALAALGSGFDCASPAEMDAVLSLGVAADRIIYANPCKPESHIAYAAAVGVDLATFDSADEVDKLRRFHPACKLLLRLKVPVPADTGTASGGVQDLGTKFGAEEQEVAPLLRAARGGGLAVSGVSFHAGSPVYSVGAYDAAVHAARRAFDAAAALGLPPLRVLDVGGGFTAGTASAFPDACDAVHAALDRHFGDMTTTTMPQVIGEPGRYFAETPFTLAARVFGKRVRGDVREYWIDDGCFGTLAGVHGDCYVPRPVPIVLGDGETRTHPSTVFGPTLDSQDVVASGYRLPELYIGDWLVFHDVGAYGSVLSSSYNGFSASGMKTYVVTPSV